ncbi:response regulator [bacterium]|nr:response regulator [bacterium]
MEVQLFGRLSKRAQRLKLGMGLFVLVLCVIGSIDFIFLQPDSVSLALSVGSLVLIGLYLLRGKLQSSLVLEYYFLLIFPAIITIGFYRALVQYPETHIDSYIVVYLMMLMPIFFFGPLFSNNTTVPAWVLYLSPIINSLSIVLFFVAIDINYGIFELETDYWRNLIISVVVSVMCLIFIIYIAINQSRINRINIYNVAELTNTLKDKNEVLNHNLTKEIENFQTLFSNSRDLMCKLGADAEILDANDIFYETLALSGQEKHNFIDYVNPASINKLPFYNEASSLRKTEAHDLRMLNAQGRHIFLDGLFIRLSSGAKPAEYLVILRNITDHRIREVRDNELIETFGAVMRNLNHKLRGPLSTAMAVRHLYELKSGSQNDTDACEGFNLMGNLLSDIDQQLKFAVEGLEGYEDIWLNELQNKSKVNVVIIDDNENDTMVLKSHITDRVPHVNVVAFSDSRMALFYLRNSVKKVDKVFLDLQMPDIGGVEIIKAVAAEGLNVTQLYTLSAHSIEYLSKRGVSVDRFPFLRAHIEKPIKDNEIMNILQK